jgi:hypothetical protein
VGGTVIGLKKRKKSSQKSSVSRTVKIVEEIQQLVYSAKFEQALLVLNQSLLHFERKNDFKLNQRCLRLRNRCEINLSYQKQLNSLTKAKLSREEMDKCLLDLWKDIHSPKHKEYIDPQIKTLIVTKIRECRTVSASKYSKDSHTLYQLVSNSVNTRNIG